MSHIVIKCNPQFPEIQSLAAEIAKHGVPAGAEIIYNGRRNQLYKLPWAGNMVCIKAFRIPAWINRLAYTTVRHSKAWRSYHYALRLRELGFLSPMPLAYVEIRHGLLLERSYYICEYVEADTARDWELRPDCDAMLSAMAADLVRMHRAGVWHKDYSPGNILINGNDRDGYTFQYVDLNRMRFGVHDPKMQMRNFRCIHLDEAETARFARHYAAAAGTDPAKMEEIALAQLREYKKKKGLHNRIFRH